MSSVQKLEILENINRKHSSHVLRNTITPHPPLCSNKLLLQKNRAVKDLQFNNKPTHTIGI